MIDIPRYLLVYVCVWMLHFGGVICRMNTPIKHRLLVTSGVASGGGVEGWQDLGFCVIGFFWVYFFEKFKFLGFSQVKIWFFPQKI